MAHLLEIETMHRHGRPISPVWLTPQVERPSERGPLEPAPRPGSRPPVDPGADSFNDLAGLLAHELRAPVRRMKGFASALLTELAPELAEVGAHRLQRIVANAEALEGLLDDLLQLAEVGHWPVSRRALDVSAIARELVAAHPDAARPELAVIIHPAMTLEADPRLLRLALRNLLDNAFKFTQRSAQGRIEVGLDAEGGERVLFVRDNGVGFDLSQVSRLYTPFQRLHGSEGFAGSGLGLTLVHQVAVSHGGRTWARSRAGEGATFYLTLERAPGR